MMGSQLAQQLTVERIDAHEAALSDLADDQHIVLELDTRLGVVRLADARGVAHGIGEPQHVGQRERGIAGCRGHLQVGALELHLRLVLQEEGCL